MPLLHPRRRRGIKCFPIAEAGRLGLNTLPARPRPIDITKIVGTVDRCEMLTPTFLPKKGRERSARFRSVLRAMSEDVPLPPIEVYQLHRDYYVIDGHHRVAAALRLKRAYLDAVVHPVVLPDTTYENRLNNRRMLFARRTGLQHVELSAPEEYARALGIIESYRSTLEGEDLSYAEAARRWYERVYKPFTARIASSDLVDLGAGETPGDILLGLYDYAAYETVRRGQEVDLEEALDHVEARFPAPSVMARALEPVSRTLALAVPRRRRVERADEAYKGAVDEE